ncbi:MULTISPECIES: hypothetical protein [unclassified Bacillus (in: firmicutes)]|uniref:hypothetical protein n=1 Tax=unclassified Bacillus (in: firmicutes) TaxID=185979 RepID=UPI001BECE13B|nr:MULTISPECIES: hypothetical protein [unclassified Bacillus (in: firmicutes)]MBT2725126.1 hypothetical protein [Bacillus sp. ISL-46]MBT2744407.1 hypothetical protein [Bacillus sp. ISL-77]
MANLKDKFTIEDMKEFDARLNRIFHQVTHPNTRTTVGVTELQLLGVIDYLCRTSGMLCDMIEQQLEGHIETYDPQRYIDRKLWTAENGIKNFLKVKKIDLD